MDQLAIFVGPTTEENGESAGPRPRGPAVAAATPTVCRTGGGSIIVPSSPALRVPTA